MAEADCQWYYTRRGVTHGPFPFQTIVRLVESRFLLADSYLWNGNEGGDWRPVSSFPAFEEALERAANGAAPIGPAELEAITGKPSPSPVHDEARPRMGAVLAASWRWMVLSLFRPFRFLQWAGIAFCSWMACTYTLVGIFDEETLLHEMQGGFQGGAQVIAALFLSARQWAAGLRSGGAAWSWGAMVLLYLVVACFIRAKGRLLFLHRVRFPGDPIPAAWSATNGRTFPIALFHFVLDFLFVAFEIFTAVHLFLQLDEETIRAGNLAEILRAILSDEPSRLRLSFFLGLTIGLMVVRSVAYHFVEPAYYRLRISFRAAWLLTGRLFRTQFFPSLLFFICLVLIRLVVFSVGILLASLVTMVGAPLLAILPLMLPYLIRLAFLPADYFIRSLGPRFLDAWRGGW